MGSYIFIVGTLFCTLVLNTTIKPGLVPVVQLTTAVPTMSVWERDEKMVTVYLFVAYMLGLTSTQQQWQIKVYMDSLLNIWKFLVTIASWGVDPRYIWISGAFFEGKRCAPMGTLHLPGTLQRCQSAPNMVVTSPIGWAKDPGPGFLVCFPSYIDVLSWNELEFCWDGLDILNLEVSIGW